MNHKLNINRKTFRTNQPIKCPYIEGREWSNYGIFTNTMPADEYESLIDMGFRRLGNSFYANCCDNCSACIPIRLDVNKFTAGRNMKRILKQNADLEMSVERSGIDREVLKIYAEFSGMGSLPPEKILQEHFDMLGLLFPFTHMTRFRNEHKTLGVGWIDILPNSISSVYFCYLQENSDRSLGTYSILKEIELCKKLNKRWLHLGFWVEESSRMNYKSRFTPSQILIHRKWRDMEDLTRKDILNKYSGEKFGSLNIT